MLLNPFISRYITSFSSHRDISQRWNIEFLNPVTIEIIFSDCTKSCRSSVETFHSIFFYDTPELTRIRSSRRFSFIEHSCRASQQWSIYNEVMTNYPTNVTSWEVYVSLSDIHNMLHCPASGYASATLISNYTLRLPSSTRSVQDIQRMVTLNGYAVHMMGMLHCFMIIKVLSFL